jgi:DNA polymerase-1
MNTWLLLDSNFLCWRAFHTLGGLQYGGSPTGVLYGFFKDVQTLVNTFATDKVLFCFDVGPLKRTDDLPTYKSKRKNKPMNEEELQAYLGMRKQIDDLRTKHLPEMGFANVFGQEGYEADDVIGWLVKNKIPKEDKAVIVSADKDLYQLISEQVCIYNPTKKEVMTKQAFTLKYEVRPWQWPKVKAIAGCSTDEVPGCHGVGELTAARYVNGTLPAKSKAMGLIENFDWKANMKLVLLPYPGCGPFEVREDKVDQKKWHKVADGLGMRSIKNRMPRVKGGLF